MKNVQKKYRKIKLKSSALKEAIYKKEAEERDIIELHFVLLLPTFISSINEIT